MPYYYAQRELYPWTKDGKLVLVISKLVLAKFLKYSLHFIKFCNAILI